MVTIHLDKPLSVSRPTFERMWTGVTHLYWKDAEAFRGPVKNGESGPAVTRLQGLLADLGVLRTPASGVYDADTANAVRTLQSSYGIPWTASQRRMNHLCLRWRGLPTLSTARRAKSSRRARSFAYAAADASHRTRRPVAEERARPPPTPASADVPARLTPRRRPPAPRRGRCRAPLRRWRLPPEFTPARRRFTRGRRHGGAAKLVRAYRDRGLSCSDWSSVGVSAGVRHGQRLLTAVLAKPAAQPVPNAPAWPHLPTASGGGRDRWRLGEILNGGGSWRPRRSSGTRGKKDGEPVT
jgi:peptidoglycan hydrolase-like protein with peptidoglycan-binding domain